MTAPAVGVPTPPPGPPAPRPAHSQLWGEDPVDHGLLQALGPEHEDILQHVENEVAIRPRADQPGLQEGRPLLLQGPQAALVPLKPEGRAWWWWGGRDPGAIHARRGL